MLERAESKKRARHDFTISYPPAGTAVGVTAVADPAHRGHGMFSTARFVSAAINGRAHCLTHVRLATDQYLIFSSP